MSIVLSGHWLLWPAVTIDRDESCIFYEWSYEKIS